MLEVGRSYIYSYDPVSYEIIKIISEDDKYYNIEVIYIDYIYKDTDIYNTELTKDIIDIDSYKDFKLTLYNKLKDIILQNQDKLFFEITNIINQ